MEQKNKKPTNAQLTRRIERAVLLVDRTKDTQELFFSDKGLRITVNEDYAVIATGFHRHVFTSYSNMGISRPYLYSQRFIEIANENIEEIKVDGGYSYAKLFEVLKAKEDKTEYYIADYVDKWLYNIFQPLYSIAEDSASQFLVFEDYMHNIARQSVILEEKKGDITEKAFVDMVCKNEKSFLKGAEDRVLFYKKSDEEVMRENIEAIQADEVDQQMQEQAKE